MKILPVILMMLVCSSTQARILAHWTFDESGSTTAHDSGGQFHGTLNGGAIFVPGGVSGNALSLDQASGSWVNVGTSFPGFTRGDFSVVTWVKTTTTDSDMLILAKHEGGSLNGYLLGLNTSSTYGRPDKAYFYGSTLGGGEAISTTSVNDGNWHQLVAVYTSGGHLKIYVDGGLPEDTKVGQPIVENAAPFMIGGYLSSGTLASSFTGLVDEVQVYDHALSDADIQYLFEHPGQVVSELALTIAVSEVRLCWPSRTDQTYQLQYRSKLTTNDWVNLGETVPGTGAILCRTDGVSSERRYYRVIASP